MELREYKQVVAGRINNLSEEEQGLLASLEQMPAGQVVMKILGPELFGQPQEPTPAAPADLPAQMQQAGLA